MGEIVRRFERKGLRIVKAEMRIVSEELARTHYAEHEGNTPYFSKMIDAITCGPVIAMILEGFNAVEGSRQLIGSASPHHSHVGTIRGDLAQEEAYNLVHGSDSDPSAEKEITLWFGKEWIMPNKISQQSKKGIKVVEKEFPEKEFPKFFTFEPKMYTLETPIKIDDLIDSINTENLQESVQNG